MNKILNIAKIYSPRALRVRFSAPFFSTEVNVNFRANYNRIFISRIKILTAQILVFLSNHGIIYRVRNWGIWMTPWSPSLPRLCHPHPQRPGVQRRCAAVPMCVKSLKEVIFDMLEVSFDVMQSERGPQAQNVRKL